MELVKQINTAKNLSFSQLTKYNVMVNPYQAELRDFMQTIYDELKLYFDTYLRNIANHVHNMIHDKSNLFSYENKINMIRHDLEVSMLEPIHHKLKIFIRNKSIEFIKIVIYYFMLNIPMIIYSYNEKINKLHNLIDQHKTYCFS